MEKGKKKNVFAAQDSVKSTRDEGKESDGCPKGTVRYEGRCVDPNWILFNKGQKEIDRNLHKY